MAKAEKETRFVLCIEDTDCDDLEKGKVYVLLADAEAEQEAFLRVVDESGEDYLYPESYFVPLELPGKAKVALAGGRR